MFFKSLNWGQTVTLGAERDVGPGHGDGGHGCVSVSDGGKCGVDGVRVELGKVSHSQTRPRRTMPPEQDQACGE